MTAREDQEGGSGAGMPPEGPAWQLHLEVLLWLAEQTKRWVLAERDRLHARAVKTVRHEVAALPPLDQALAAWLLDSPGLFTPAARKALPGVMDADLLSRASTRLEKALGLGPQRFDEERERVEGWLDALTERVQADFAREAEGA